MHTHKHRSFSHDVFAQVVFEKYVKTPEAHMRQHELMARYFKLFPSCPRKLDCLAYHLEAAGLWHKLKEALVDVENFRLWWTPAHKTDFVALWASLSNLNARHAAAGSPPHVRPYFDVVDEYVRSIEEYREKHHPKDEELSDVVLRVADFLLEFAFLGHEVRADVPAFLHPLVPNENLKSLGVRHLVVDDKGNARMVEPVLGAAEGLVGESSEAGGPTSTIVPKDGPPVSIYFYRRWMWMQFPLVAIANCGERYRQGLVARQHRPSLVAEEKPGSSSSSSKIPEETLAAEQKEGGEKQSKGEIPASLLKVATQPLPQLFIRKPTTARTRPPVKQPQQSHEEVAGAMEKMVSELHDDIRQYRDENDVLVQQKLLYERTLLDLANELVDLERIYEGSVRGVLIGEGEGGIGRWGCAYTYSSNPPSLVPACHR